MASISAAFTVVTAAAAGNNYYFQWHFPRFMSTFSKKKHNCLNEAVTRAPKIVMKRLSAGCRMVIWWSFPCLDLFSAGTGRSAIQWMACSTTVSTPLPGNMVADVGLLLSLHWAAYYIWVFSLWMREPQRKLNQYWLVTVAAKTVTLSQCWFNVGPASTTLDQR